MADVVMYSKEICPYCVRAKQLLHKKGVTWTEIDVETHPELRAEMIEKSGGRRTVPQIFVNGRPLGGYDDIAALDRAGELDHILGVNS